MYGFRLAAGAGVRPDTTWGGGRMAVGDGPGGDTGGDSSGVRHQRASLGQGKGPDVDLVVSGTRIYATYQTPEGFPVVYDDRLELFCYARLTPAGAFESTGVPVDRPAPPDVVRDARESDDVRAARIAARLAQLEPPSPGASPP